MGEMIHVCGLCGQQWIGVHQCTAIIGPTPKSLANVKGDAVANAVAAMKARERDLYLAGWRACQQAAALLVGARADCGCKPGSFCECYGIATLMNIADAIYKMQPPPEQQP